MKEPPSLFDPLPKIVEPKYEKEASQLERFIQFHTANPQVYQVARRKSLDLVAVGTKHYGIQAIFESMRYDYTIATRGDEFKLNNNYTAYYARLLMDLEPKLSGFFELRRLSVPIDDRLWITLLPKRQMSLLDAIETQLGVLTARLETTL